jgi:predicted ATPase
VVGSHIQGGLSRKYFLPFVELLHSRCDVLHVGSGTDYRTLPRRPDSAASLTALATATDRPAAAAVGAYFVGDDATLQLLRAWRELTGEVGAPTATKSVAAEFNRRLQVSGRHP